MSELSILIPIFNGASKLAALIDMLRKQDFRDTEIILIDDGSRDVSWDLIKKLSDTDNGPMQILGISLDRNRGQQSALLAGLAVSCGRQIITMDDDLSHPASFIPDILESLNQGFQLVYASPDRRPGRPLRALISRLHQFHMAFLTGSSLKVKVGSFRGMSRELATGILMSNSSWPYLSAQALSLRPRPSIRILPCPPWEEKRDGRFTICRLIGLELRLAVHYGPLARWKRKITQSESNYSIQSRVGSWIAERTDP